MTANTYILLQHSREMRLHSRKQHRISCLQDLHHLTGSAQTPVVQFLVSYDNLGFVFGIQYRVFGGLCCTFSCFLSVSHYLQPHSLEYVLVFHLKQISLLENLQPKSHQSVKLDCFAGLLLEKFCSRRMNCNFRIKHSGGLQMNCVPDSLLWYWEFRVLGPCIAKSNDKLQKVHNDLQHAEFRKISIWKHW